MLRSLPYSMPAFPVISPGRLAHYPFRGLLNVHLRYGLHVRRVPYRTLYTEGFNRFVTSSIAPIATGWSERCRVGFAPTGKQRLGTAHEISGLGKHRSEHLRVKQTKHPVESVQKTRVDDFLARSTSPSGK
jgi:hypothetical protein